MKKRVFAFLSVFVLLFLSACGAAPTETKETAPSIAPQTAVSETEPASTKNYPAITSTVTREMLREIPVATPEMTEDELRDICVRYMALQQSVVWTPDADLSYYCDTAASADRDGNINLPAGRRYAGMPYSKAAQDLEGFLDYLDEKTAVLPVAQFKSNAGDVFGNHCTTSTFWAWARISSTYSVVGNSRFVLSNGFNPLGDYALRDVEKYDETYDTFTAVAENGQQTMYRAYALFKPASGMFSFRNGTVGHARMAQENAVVVKNADGTINGDESYVNVIEQVSVVDETQNEDGKVYAIGKVGKKYSFEELYRTGYLPFEISELCGKATVQKPRIELSFREGDPFSAILEGEVTSNYAISRVDLSFVKADGSPAYEAFKLGYGNDGGNEPHSRIVRISEILNSLLVKRKLTSGENYTMKLTVRLGNGETFTPFEGKVTA